MSQLLYEEPQEEIRIALIMRNKIMNCNEKKAILKSKHNDRSSKGCKQQDRIT